jgi:hypothetical protein
LRNNVQPKREEYGKKGREKDIFSYPFLFPTAKWVGKIREKLRKT